MEIHLCLQSFTIVLSKLIRLLFMASKEKIRQHLAQSATIKLDRIAEPTKGDEAKKMKMMEHVEKSKGKV